jgi:apolipoprotein N-acyltransferase
LRVFGGLPEWLSGVLLLGLAAYLALFYGLFAGLGRRLWGLAPPLALLTLPALWVALEWLREYLFSGFPWNPPALAWVEMAGALPLSAWVGAHGITYLLVFANGGLALGLARRAWEPALVGLLFPLALLPVGGRWGAGPSKVEPVMPVSEVVILQPNLANELDPSSPRLAEGLSRVLRVTREECRPGNLILWPESVSWPRVLELDADFRRRLAEAVKKGCTVLLNSPHLVEEGEGGRSYTNAAFLVESAGVVGRYDKRHLVPFGEYVPLAGVFSFIDKLARNAGDFRRGQVAQPIPFAEEQLGVAVCYEVVFPQEVAELAREGATLLVSLTNDAWYGDTAAPWQHYRAARFRAAESRRPLLRAAITGISAVVASDGSERRFLGPFEEGVIRARVRGRRDLSPFSRMPWAVPAASVLVAGIGIALSLHRSWSKSS